MPRPTRTLSSYSGRMQVAQRIGDLQDMNMTAKNGQMIKDRTRSLPKKAKAKEKAKEARGVKDRARAKEQIQEVEDYHHSRQELIPSSDLLV